METTKLLKLYKQITPNAGAPFPDRDSTITSFKYSAKRMGNAPTISATFLYEECLDDKWSDKVFTVFNGEKYYLKNTPSSSYDNTSCLYKHTLEFVSERVVLESVYFFDVVLTQDAEKDPLTTNSNFPFSGNLHKFAELFNRSAAWSNLEYSVEVDSDVPDEEKFIEFQDQFLYDALKQAFEVFDVPFYFVGKKIHIGYAQNVISDPIRYGEEDALISISRNNSGTPIVNRVTGTGSDRNITYYYPNPTPKGTISLGGKSSQYYYVEDYVDFANNVDLGRPFHCEVGIADVLSNGQLQGEFKELYNSRSFLFHETDVYNEYNISISFKARYSGTDTTYAQIPIRIWATADGKGVDLADNFIKGELSDDYGNTYDVTTETEHFPNEFFTEELVGYYNKNFTLNLTYGFFSIKHFFEEWNDNNQNYIFAELLDVDSVSIVDMQDVSCTVSMAETFAADTNIGVLRNGAGRIFIDSKFSQVGKPEVSAAEYFKKGVVLYDGAEIGIASITSVGTISCGYLEPGPYTVRCSYSLSFPLSPNDTNVTSEVTPTPVWVYDDIDTYIDTDKAGIRPVEGYTPGNGDRLEQTLIKRVNVQNNLMPSIYRETDGLERFYNAENSKYTDEDGNEITFKNPYSETRPREHILEDDEIYPTITGTLNAEEAYIDEILDVAYDKYDNDEIYPEGDPNAGKYKHPYFFVKLRKFDGEHGFNLFDHAIENNPMTISMTTGDCGACEFTIGVNDNNKNTVQVDENGSLVYDEDTGDVKFGTPQDIQNDTFNNEVWIALKKDIDTYGVVMPNVESNQYVKSGDKFVILHIDLPDAYVFAAEKRLEDAIIKYMSENNSEKYTYSVKFSRIFFEENYSIAPMINENAVVKLEYNGTLYDLFITSFSFNMNGNSPLPEITAELEEEITIKKGIIEQLREQASDVLKPQLIVISKNLKDNNLTIQTLQTSISNTNQSNQLLIEDIQNRLLVVEENTGTVDLTELKVQVNNNTQKLQEQGNLLNGHSTQLLALNINYETLKSTVQGQGTLLLKIETDVKNIDNRVTNVENKVKVVVVTPNSIN